MKERNNKKMKEKKEEEERKKKRKRTQGKAGGAGQTHKDWDVRKLTRNDLFFLLFFALFSPF